MDNITGLIDTFGNFGIMGVIVYAFMKGYLIPRPIHDEMIESKDKEIESLKERLGE